MSKEMNKKPTYQKMKPWLLTLLYLAIFIALYLIYGSGDTHNNFIYNEF
ncbi:teichoic acid D-Ala incorporation-associated protein DltX [Staphylococcus saprophyticus]|uniref:Teichoic acid D-Ala incorporation-associated protein DltX n=2 Tax=Staphylococcus saprophyticus TaxID=29385 RepID=Q49W70_STAS1|nr:MULTISPECIES: teichoic acid D-Ala incorporation-associated protein DltX [Staphylococcus]CRV24297.1 D-Ala-teichoic acid biosynthesis protein [Streptococcus equi subsp. equi]AMG20923.2 teichoic acid D-Ala incorporation-associated protein DltX [Staphylococcus saprophyticus]AMG33993.2 teichoic acid D-Ala incorporation-associated protein DltX [Staphylococcus saprophyticus]ASE59834.1 teichoic acid D-Ala incorporation-associated protein DltX [Staphylococcus saprophyticus]ASF18638.1 teichoic acid D